MRVREVVSSLTFRFIARYVLVLSATVTLIVVGMYSFYSYNYFSSLSRSIMEEQQTLNLVYEGQSLAGVEQYVRDQGQSQMIDHFYYLVSDDQGNKVAGDLPAATAYREFEGGWLGFELAMLEWGKSVDLEFLAREVVLGEQYRVLVARSYQEAVAQGRLVLHTLVRTMLVTIILGLVGGYFAAARSLQRFEWLGREMTRIVRGNPSQRLHAEAEKGQVRELAQVINAMLDQTELLMHGVRSVSDNIAHDLRTPLARLRNRLSQLGQELPPQHAESVAQLMGDCDALLASFNAVLRISALEAGSRYSGDAQVDLRQLLKDAVELYDPLAQEKAIDLTIDALPAANCRGEADLLFQLLANVLDNAIKYTPGGGTVRVSLAPAASGEGYQVVIADSGPGISSEHWGDVFRRFYRVEPSRSALPGHGLGLSMARAIAQYHGGDIDLEDNAPGLRVIIKLP